ncbi:Pre-mRNA-processing factor 6 [Wickerhamomyces ciferrii]|uniref:mRNA 3'-end-processing protein RNA14 n=1 Tax=Wickerhamomyces ciferrii (strain ATCC 14091 / BCRC 22168 / CBS 111 / JCM 3599 / NBRC 0793 / NRRL Y-1031 F-60-10) TaxID=1206466 RepID=K0KGN9_WICCF|nr:Pre-mRNA-processing factor 6 [Wickerhamomyces ciferrii]CCH41347.1 Pre-mRNA-processing factor 6 [Wickerhamomyces ciferrii]
MERKAFLDQEAPIGYIAGIGRGATGFTTRADVGAGRLPPQQRDIGSDDEDNYQDVDEDGLLGDKTLNKEDEEADEIYQEIDNRLKNRNKRRISPNDDATTTGNNGNDDNLTKISNQFVDLKKNLSSISEDQWANLPEVGDLTKRNKRQRKLLQEQKRTYAAPDSLLAGLGGSNGNLDSSVDLGALTSERQKLLGSKIDSNFDFNEDNDVDQESYLNEISNLSQNNEEEIKRIKTLLSSFTKADPKKPEGWIARARLEEFNKNFENAKKLIQQGCNNCPFDEEIWLENIRLNRSDIKYSKIIVAEAINLNSKSLKLWLKAIELELEIFNKKRVIRKALENLPTSVELWEKSINLEDDLVDKLKIATKATELIPEDESLWLLLIDLQSYDEAKSTLNKARKALPNNVNIWLTAIKLEFQNNPESDKISKMIKKTFKECKEVTRSEWFKIAINLEKIDKLTYLTTLIVDEILSLEELDYNSLLLEAENYKEYLFVYKSILNFIIIKFPKKAAIWRRLIGLYKNNFDSSELYKIFENIIEILPKNATFWLMYSKEVWKNGDLSKAKEILNNAFKLHSQNADIWLALIKLESVEHNYSKVDSLFQKAKEQVNNERIWYKYVTFLRQQGSQEKALEAIDLGLEQFPKCFKLYLQKSTILEELGDLNQARNVLSLGTKTIPESIELWDHLSNIDYKLGNHTRARSDLDLGLLKNPKSDKLWGLKLELEKILQNNEQINVILTKALKNFPHSPILWEFNLKFNNKKSLRKTLYQDALNSTNNNVRILLIIGYNFWIDGKFDKAKRWFERAIIADEDFGDSWAWYYNFLIKNNESQIEIDEFLKKFQDVEPRHGDLWPRVSKKLENLDKQPVEILKLVASELLK